MERVSFEQCGGATIAEIGIAVMLMRSPDATLSDFADGFRAHFKVPVDVAEMRSPYTRMLERGWIEHHPTQPGVMLVTRKGETVTYAAFSGFVRLVDPNGNYFKASIIYAMTTRQHQEDDDD